MRLPTFETGLVKNIFQRVNEKRKFIQVIIGPRQVGKTTAVLQLIKKWEGEAHYAAADLPAPPQAEWINQQWELARLKAEPNKTVLLILDEVQKIQRWSDVVKNNWEYDDRNFLDIRLIILGSSSQLLQSGLSESLAGRFELLHALHWNYPDIKNCFGWDIDKYIFYGAYPGAADLVSDENRWRQYIIESLIETVIGKDIIQLNRVDKPSLLRQFFMLAVEYSGQILSYNKLVGQLQDAGNTTTLAHYQNLLTSAGLLVGLNKYYDRPIKRKTSIPKWITQNTALNSAISSETFDEIKQNTEKWGRLVETAVGAFLFNSAIGKSIEVYYWRDKNREVDFILKKADKIIAIEVKSGKIKNTYDNLNFFSQNFNSYRNIIVGKEGIDFETFLTTEIEYWFK